MLKYRLAGTVYIGGHAARLQRGAWRPVGMAMVHALRRRSFPPATFRRASSAEAAGPLLHWSQPRTSVLHPCSIRG